MIGNNEISKNALNIEKNINTNQERNSGFNLFDASIVTNKNVPDLKEKQLIFLKKLFRKKNKMKLVTSIL